MHLIVTREVPCSLYYSTSRRVCKRRTQYEGLFQELSSRNLRAIGCLASESLSGGRISTISPSTSRQTTSAIRWICLMLWETIMIVIPHFVFSFINTSSMFSVEIGSNALVGSSSNNTFSRVDMPMINNTNITQKLDSLLNYTAINNQTQTPFKFLDEGRRGFISIPSGSRPHNLLLNYLNFISNYL